MALTRTVFELMIAALVVWRVSTTLATAKVFEPFRVWLCPEGAGRGECRTNRVRAWLYELITCQFCISHYVALVYMVFWHPALVATGTILADLAITWFAVVAVSSIIARAFQRREPPVPPSLIAALEQYLRTQRRRRARSGFEPLLSARSEEGLSEESTVLHT